MPIIKSAIKQMRVSLKKQQRNLITKKNYKSLIKDFLRLIKEKKNEEASKLLPLVQKAIDTAVKKNILHKNTAGRKKSVLTKQLKTKTTPKATATKTKTTSTPKTTTKKSTPKATAKPAAKKKPTKKITKK